MQEDKQKNEFKEIFEKMFKFRKIVDVEFNSQNIAELTFERLLNVLNSDWSLLRIYLDRDKLKEHMLTIGFKSDIGLTFYYDDIYITFHQVLEYIQVMEYGQHKNFENIYLHGILKKRNFFKTIRPHFNMSSAHYAHSNDGCLDTITYYYNDNRKTKGTNLSLFGIIEKPYDVFDKDHDRIHLQCSFFEVVYIDVINGNHYKLSDMIKYFDGKESLHMLNDKSYYYDLKNLFTKKEIELLNMMHI